MNIRFLTANEYAGTASLFTECFGFDAEFMEEFYGSSNADGSVNGVIKDGIIAAACDGSEYRAMVQVIYKTAVPIRHDGKAAAADKNNKISGTEADALHNMTAQNAENNDILAAAEDKIKNKAEQSVGRGIPADKEKISAYKVPYIMGVCTSPEYRHRGLMDRLMTLVIDKLKADGYPWCFLIAVDRNIYRHLGFTHDWKLSDAECGLLYADDGLDTASGRLINADHIENVRIV